MTVTRDRLADTGIALGVAAVLVLVAAADLGGGAGPAAYLWAAGLGVLMFWRRRHSRAALALTVLGLFAYYAAGFPAIGVAVPVAAALYSAAEAGHRRFAVAGAVALLVVSISFRLAEGDDFRYVVLYEGVGHVALMAAAIALGELVRARRQIAALTSRHVAVEAERRLAEHNQALSRELHDSIGHTLTVAAIHTNVARQEAGRDPAAAAEALDRVTDALSLALADLRGTVRQLRAGPQPSLDDVDDLMDVARAAGFEVRARIEPVDAPALSATAYRLVQEGMTNALRHSNGRVIDVGVRHRDGALLVHVEDDGTAADAAESTGLTGLRERVAALGGRLDAGPVARGWRVSAALPLAGRR